MQGRGELRGEAREKLREGKREESKRQLRFQGKLSGRKDNARDVSLLDLIDGSGAVNDRAGRPFLLCKIGEKSASQVRSSV
jgi:hypothetical protein